MYTRGEAMAKIQKNPKTVSQYELLRMLKDGEKGAQEEMRRRMTLLDAERSDNTKPGKPNRES